MNKTNKKCGPKIKMASFLIVSFYLCLWVQRYNNFYSGSSFKLVYMCIYCGAIEISVMPCKFLLSGVFFYSASSFKFLSLNYNRDVFIKRTFLSFKRYTAVLFRFSLPGAFLSFNFCFLNVTVWNLDTFHIKSQHSSHTMQCLSSFLRFPIFLV